MPITLKKFRRRGYGKNRIFKIGDRVRTIKSYAEALSPKKMFTGRVKGIVRREGFLNDIVVVDSDDGARHEIDSSWLELMPNE